MELYEQIRREYEHGGGTIKGMAKEAWDSPADGARGGGKRSSAKAQNQHERKAEDGTGDGLCRCDPGGGREGAPEATAHGAPDLVSNPGGDA